MGRGGESGIAALARASGQSPPHGGGYFRFGNERVNPLVFPLKPQTALVRRSLRSEVDQQQQRPRNGATPTGDVTASRARDKAVARQRSAAIKASARPALIRQEERRERQRVSQTTPLPERRLRCQCATFTFPHRMKRELQPTLLQVFASQHTRRANLGLCALACRIIATNSIPSQTQMSAERRQI
jgi:hypothetical protein